MMCDVILRNNTKFDLDIKIEDKGEQIIIHVNEVVKEIKKPSAMQEMIENQIEDAERESNNMGDEG